MPASPAPGSDLVALPPRLLEVVVGDSAKGLTPRAAMYMRLALSHSFTGGRPRCSTWKYLVYYTVVEAATGLVIIKITITRSYDTKTDPRQTNIKHDKPWT